MFDTVLIPVDFSQDIEKLNNILTKLDAKKILILNVIDKLEVSLYNELFSAMTSAPETSNTPTEENFKELPLYKKHTEKLDQYKLSLLKKGYSVETYIRYGVPYKKIVEFSEEMKVDLIIIPAVGKRLSLLKEVMMMGGTATRVLRLSKIPLLIIR